MARSGRTASAVAAYNRSRGSQADYVLACTEQASPQSVPMNGAEVEEGFARKAKPLTILAG
jgi:hypothetical protein